MALTPRLHDAQDMSNSMPVDPREILSLAKLVELHAEATFTTQLGNLLTRSLVTAASLACLTGFVVASDLQSLTAGVVWAGLVMAGALAMLCSYSKAVASPFLSESLENFPKQLLPIALYCGTAWGAGAFLVLPAGTDLVAAALFVGAPTLAVALTLRERELVLAFVLPMLALSSFAALLRPFPDATLTAALMLVTGIVMAVPPVLVARKRAAEMSLPHLPTN